MGENKKTTPHEYLKAGNIGEALYSYQEYLKQHPDDQKTRMEYALCRLMNGENNEFIEEVYMVKPELISSEREKSLFEKCQKYLAGAFIGVAAVGTMALSGCDKGEKESTDSTSKSSEMTAPLNENKIPEMRPIATKYGVFVPEMRPVGDKYGAVIPPKKLPEMNSENPVMKNPEKVPDKPAMKVETPMKVSDTKIPVVKRPAAMKYGISIPDEELRPKARYMVRPVSKYMVNPNSRNGRKIKNPTEDL
ncbi:MAG: tetratricopeptide repeat protein [Deltaproteobacteria bacterium]|nr:tetratricopeptide repeat protein [Deltaproteobacteria bacterium]